MLGFFKFFMFCSKLKYIITIGLIFLVPSIVIGASDIKKVKRLVARLQMEILELKEKSSIVAGQQMAILEPQNEKIKNLTDKNLELSSKLKNLERKFLILDDKLEKYKNESGSEKFSELNDLATVLTLISVGEISTIEELLLELINKENLNLKEDLLILLLAETQKNQGYIEQSLSYYVKLITDHPKSPYLNRTIFEASELLGKMGLLEEQNSMLEALKESGGKYGILARKKLGIEEPIEALDNNEAEDVKQEIPETEEVVEAEDVQEETPDTENTQSEVVEAEEVQKETIKTENAQTEVTETKDNQVDSNSDDEEKEEEEEESDY